MVKAVRVDKQNWRRTPLPLTSRFKRTINTMKTLTKLALAVLTLTTAFTARAEWVRGHFRSNGTYVAPYYRTPANGIPYDNLSYRSSTPSYSAYSYAAPVYSPSYRHSPCDYGSSSSFSVYGSSTRLGDFTFHNYYTSGGGIISGTTTTIGNSSFTSIYGW